MSDLLEIVSICRELPNPQQSSMGIFVARRLEAMTVKCAHTIVQPVNYFPLIKKRPVWARSKVRNIEGMNLQISQEPMFYIPKFLKGLDGYWLRRAVSRKLREISGKRRIDLVDAHFGYPEGVGSFAAAHDLGIPCLVTLRGFEAEYLDRPYIGNSIRRMLRRVDGCICVSHFLRDLAIANGANPETTTVIHNAIDRTLFYPGIKLAERQRLGLNESEKIVISVGHLISRKGHHRLIDAFAEVARNDPNSRLIIVGGASFEHEYPADVRKQIHRLSLESQVSILGDVDASEIPGWLRAADVFALATSREGCCNAILEALACGLPVVTTPVGDNAWFVKEGENGFIVPLDGRQALANALNYALNNEWAPQHISESLSVGSWDEVADDVIEFANRIVQTKRMAVDVS